MGARIQNTPFYVVYDRSYNYFGNITHTGSTGAVTETGSQALMFDSDLTSACVFTCHATGANPEIDTIFDLGRIFFNCQVSYKVALSSVAIAADEYISYSTDGITYTDFEHTAGNMNLSNAKAALALRYIRIRGIAIAPGAELDYTHNVYEMRIMASN